MRKTAVILIYILIMIAARGQQKDSIILAKEKLHFVATFETVNEKYKNIKSFALPVGLVAYGFVAFENDALKKIDRNTKLEIIEGYSKPITKLDDYLQYLPAIAVYGLNAIGVMGKNNFRDRTIIYSISTVISTAIIFPLKQITKVERPDGSNNKSFPSGHTAIAFASAEFMRQEYKAVSPLYGIAGYAVAATTGVLRIYNNKHWVSDVIAGAGFGILSTKLAYWIYPSIKKKYFKAKPLRPTAMLFY